jgi:hypothetical protein
MASPVTQHVTCLRSDPRFPFLQAWYSQNQVHDLPIRPFLYGVHLGTAPTVIERIGRSGPTQRRVFVPFATMHPHLSGVAHATRAALTP